MISDPDKIDELRFWGRIRGTKSNYYIAVATKYFGEYESPAKAFYYSTNDFNFKRLPFVIWKLKNFIDCVENQDFVGEPGKVLWENKAADKEVENPDAEVGEAEEENNKNDNPEDEIVIGESNSNGTRKKNGEKITELEKLSFVVRSIENECAVVPVGSFKIMPNHQMRLLSYCMTLYS